MALTKTFLIEGISREQAFDDSGEEKG